MADSTTTVAEEKKIAVRCSDGEEFVVDMKAAMLSQTIKNMIDNDCANGIIPLPNVTGQIMSKIIEYCNKHSEVKEGENNNEALKNFDKKLVNVEQGVPHDLILASNYLDIKGLLDLTCQTVADMIKGKSPDEIRKLFNIENDFTPQEEEEIRRENAWAFE